MTRRVRQGLWLSITLLSAAGLLAAVIYLTSREDVTNLDNGLLEFIFFFAGVVLSYVFGRQSIAAEAAASVRRDGRKAVRRIVNLARGLQDVATTLSETALHLEGEETADGKIVAADVQYTLKMLRSHVDVQLRTVADAIEDWRDIVPEEVEELERRARATG